MAKHTKPRPRVSAFEDDDARPKDFDPEALDSYLAHSDDSDLDGEGEQEDHSRSHYAEVEKSKLRQKNIATLGPQYRGSKVTRHAAFEDDSDDPFERGFNETDEVDDETLSVKGPTHRNGIEVETSDDDEDSFNEVDDEDGGVDLSGDEDDDGDEDEDENEGSEDGRIDKQGNSRRVDDIDRAELRKIMAEEQQNVSATLSQAVQAHATKGRAVEGQRKASDKLLNVRIRLQKALVATNSLVAEKPSAAISSEDVVSNAETAAMNLWTSLNDLRTNLQQACTGDKRKHSALTADATPGRLWARMQSLEGQQRSYRQGVLDRWSAKARGATAALTSGRARLNNTVQEQSLTDVLNSQLLDHDRLVKRTRTPRSCAPVQANASISEDMAIYDDADFYGLLLKELLEQRNADTAIAGLDFNIAPWQAAREAKTKKVVDTKASKGRKLRYTVHEKLQNFMAPEDRTTWGERQVDELFGSLFGQKVQLGEMEGPSSDEEGGNDAGLMLFRS